MEVGHEIGVSEQFDNLSSLSSIFHGQVAMCPPHLTSLTPLILVHFLWCVWLN